MNVEDHNKLVVHLTQILLPFLIPNETILSPKYYIRLRVVSIILRIVCNFTALAKQRVQLSKAATPHSKFCQLLNGSKNIKPFQSLHCKKEYDIFRNKEISQFMWNHLKHYSS